LLYLLARCDFITQAMLRVLLLLVAVHGEFLSPLQRAIRQGDASSVKNLLAENQENDQGYSYDDELGFGRTPLHEAVELGHQQVVEEILLSDKRLVSAPDELGWTPLHWAALKGFEDIAKHLLKAKAQVDAKENEFGCEPLQWAARRGHLQLIRLLLNHGAKTSYQDKENRTAATWAQVTNHLNAFALLENLDLREDEEQQHESYNMTPLHVAVVENNVTEMKRIFQSTNVEEMLSKADAWGRTPLIACIQASQKLGPGSEKLVMQFIKLMKALPNFSEKIAGFSVPDPNLRDPVHWAVLAGHRAAALELSQLMPSHTPAEDRWGRRLFHHAASNGHTALMAWLLDIRSQIDGLSGALQTPLHLAAQGGHQDMIQLLLKRKAPVAVRDRLMRNPLHYAILQGSKDVAEILMKAGTDAMQNDMDGLSPLFFAANLMAEKDGSK